MKEVINTEAKMTSLEIAELTQKEHRNVTQDIRKLIDKEIISPLNFEQSTYENERGKEYPMYLLDFKSTMLLVTGYDVKRRAIVIDRWLALERGEVAPALSSGDIPLTGILAEIRALRVDFNKMNNQTALPGRQRRFIDLSNVEGFLQCCQIGSGNFITKTRLYEAFRLYCLNTATHLDSKPNFFAKLYRCLPQLSHGRVLVAGSRTAIVTGLALQEELEVH